jgi:hypothetical protein
MRDALRGGAASGVPGAVGTVGAVGAVGISGGMLGMDGEVIYLYEIPSVRK